MSLLNPPSNVVAVHLRLHALSKFPGLWIHRRHDYSYEDVILYLQRFLVNSVRLLEGLAPLLFVVLRRLWNVYLREKLNWSQFRRTRRHLFTRRSLLCYACCLVLKHLGPPLTHRIISVHQLSIIPQEAVRHHHKVLSK